MCGESRAGRKKSWTGLTWNFAVLTLALNVQLLTFNLEIRSVFEILLVVVVFLMLLCLARLAAIRTRLQTLSCLDAEADALMEADGVDFDPFPTCLPKWRTRSSGVRR